MADDSDFDFFVLTPSDFADATDIIAREFFTREPLTQGTHASNVQVRKGRVADDIRMCLEAGVSVGVRHRPTGELVGVRISFIKSRAGSSPPPQPANELEALFRVYDEVMKEVDVFEAQDVDKVLSMYMVGVHRDFGGRGLGRKLVERCMEKGVEKGCQLAVTCITNKYSGRIFEKLGYEVRHCLDLTSLGPEWGVDTSVMGENTTVRVMVKRLP
ncbi:arylalkylamine N-acetyltransferase 1 [Penaeus vannamei]|uniref:arylalkylamine N-acetyltransferase 1 n=1 Tax=Penaeus vannamei TaxID=6689 RepID=UPI00387FAFEB